MLGFSRLLQRSYYATNLRSLLRWLWSLHSTCQPNSDDYLLAWQSIARSLDCLAMGLILLVEDLHWQCTSGGCCSFLQSSALSRSPVNAYGRTAAYHRLSQLRYAVRLGFHVIQLEKRLIFQTVSSKMSILANVDLEDCMSSSSLSEFTWLIGCL